MPTVLNSRPREQAAELSRLLARAGCEVLLAPAIETVSAWDAAELEAVRRDLAADAYAWIVLASQNAGRWLVDELRRSGNRLVCGSASARALGLSPQLALERFSASAAFEAVRSYVQAGQRILIPRAADGSAELAGPLQALGASVDAPIAYRTVAVNPATLAHAAARLHKREVSAVTVCSPSAINSLLAGVGRDALLSARLVCLGTTTANAARLAELKVDAVAEKTTMAALVAAALGACTSATVTA